MPVKNNITHELSEAEAALGDFWVRFADLLGFPRSVGRIYGLVFARGNAVSADDCVKLLGISRSSAGQGIKFLLDLGALKPDLRNSTRSECYLLVDDLGILIANLLQRRLFPALDELDTRLATIRDHATTAPELKARIDKLESWRTKALPVISRIREVAIESPHA